MTAKNRRKVIAAVVGLIVVVGVVVWFTHGPWSHRGRSQGPAVPAVAAGKPSTARAVENRRPAPPAPILVPPATTRPAPPPPAPPPPLPDNVTLAHALQLVQDGKLLAARRELSALIFSGTLTEPQAEEARTAATRVAEQTLLSPQFYEGDPYTFQYTFATGDTLNKVERQLTLHVPAQLILRINGIARGSTIRAGQSVKMIQGPFHAVVRKGDFTLDLYLQREGMEKVFIKRVRVGLGADGSTPIGAWKVGLGRKMIDATWFPPASSPIHQPLRPGDPSYPLGKAGYWIGLIGTDPNTTSCDGYGLHGTNDPNSIGKAASLGCIRLADPDIELVFSVLYEEWSTVQTLP